MFLYDSLQFLLTLGARVLEMRRLRLLRELSVRGSVSAVAEALNYSPSAVSQQLGLLERETGIELVRKVGRGVALTPAGEALASDAEQLLASLESTEARLRRQLPEASGRIRVAVFQTAALALMPAALNRLRRKHPRLRVEMVQHEPETALRETWARSFDLVIAEQYPGHAAPHFAGLDRVSLIQDPIQLALPPRGVSGITSAGEADAASGLAGAKDLPWVMEPRGAASRHWAEQACRVAGFEPDVRFETADLQTHLRLIETGNAVALLPGLVHEGRATNVRLVDLPEYPQRTVFTAARAASQDHPALAAVREVLLEVAAALEFTRSHR